MPGPENTSVVLSQYELAEKHPPLAPEGGIPRGAGGESLRWHVLGHDLTANLLSFSEEPNRVVAGNASLQAAQA